jgi:hypothetical protein
MVLVSCFCVLQFVPSWVRLRCSPRTARVQMSRLQSQARALQSQLSDALQRSAAAAGGLAVPGGRAVWDALVAAPDGATVRLVRGAPSQAVAAGDKENRPGSAGAAAQLAEKLARLNAALDDPQRHRAQVLQFPSWHAHAKQPALLASETVGACIKLRRIAETS